MDISLHQKGSEMKRFRVVLYALLMLVWSAVPALSQPATPTALGETPVGSPVTIYDTEGNVAAAITVVDVVDPFEQWSEYLGPQVGERYVSVTLQIDNTGTRPFDFDPMSFTVLDSLGRMYMGGMPVRSPQAIAEVPDLESASMLPGESITGAIVFTVPSDASLVQVVYLFYPLGSGSIYVTQQMYLLAALTAP